MANLNQFPGTAYSAVTLGMRGCVNAQDPLYGADPTGVNNSAPAIQAAITALSSIGGGIVWLGAGTFKIKSTITFASGVSIIGAGHAATTIMVDDSGGAVGDAFVMSAVHHCGLNGLTISASSVRSAGRAIHISGGDTTVQLGSFKISRAQHFIDVDMNNQYDGILIDDVDANNGNWATTVGCGDRTAIWRNFATNRYAYDLNSPHGASHQLKNIFVYGNATPANGPYAFRVRGTGDLTATGLSTWGVVNGLLIDPDGIGAESVMELKFAECYFDFASGACFRYNPGALVAVPLMAQFSNVWFASSSTSHGAHGSNPNNISSQVTFKGCEFLNNAGYGLRGDTNCTSSNFGTPVTSNAFYGPPLANTSGDTQYV